MNRPVADVFDAVFDAAVGLGFWVAQADPDSGYLVLDRPGLFGASPRRFAVAVTDSGIGSTVVHVSWQIPRAPWPLRSEGRRAARLCRGTERVLAARPAD